MGEFDLDPSPDRFLSIGALSVGGELSDPWESDNGPSDELPCPESDLELLPLRNLGMWSEIPLDCGNKDEKSEPVHVRDVTRLAKA